MAATSLYLEGGYLRNHPSYHVEDSAWKAARVADLLDRHGVRPATVGDVGCGAGEVLRQLQLRLPEATTFHGYDISPAAVEVARSRENPRLGFTCGDLLQAETPGFDVLLCLDVVEHVEDHLGFLRGLRTKGLHKVFHIPLDMCAQMVLRARPIVQLRTSAGHIHSFMKETALLALRETGYTVVAAELTAGGVELARSWKAKAAWLPRKALAAVSPDLAARALGGYSLLVLTT